MSPRFQRSVIALALILMALSPALTARAADSQKAMYSWIDEKGTRQYGDRIPPQYSKQERRVLNEHGVEVNRLEAEKTEAQRAEEEARRLAISNAQQRDQILLTTYVSVEQIQQLRDQRLDMVQGQVKVASQYLATLSSRLKELQAQAQTFKPYSSSTGAGPMPDVLAKDLVRTVNEIRVQERLLTGKHAEQTQMRQQFQSDIDRYRQLRGIK